MGKPRDSVDDSVDEIVEAFRKIAVEKLPPLQFERTLELLENRWGTICNLVSLAPEAAQPKALELLVRLVISKDVS